MLYRQEEVNNSANNSPQKSGNGFKLFQSNQDPNQQVSPPQNGSMSPSGSGGQAQAPPQPNGILKNSYDRDAMSRVGQR